MAEIGSEAVASACNDLKRNAETADRPADAAMRIALVTGNFGYIRDGASQALNLLVDHLSRAGHIVRVYTPAAAECAVAAGATLVSIPSIKIPRRSEYRLALGLPRAQRRDLVSFRPDVLHLAAPDLLGFAALRLAERCGWPVIASLHTRFETYLEFYKLGWLRPLVEQRLHAFYRRADLVLAPTRSLCDDFASQGLGAKVRLWSRGVDRSRFDPQRRDPEWRRARGFRDDDIVLLFFGRLVREKGTQTFVDTVRLLRARGFAARVLIVGDGPERHSLAGHLPDAEFTGFLTGDELGRALASSDIFVNPSRSEAFGNVNLEAMAAGLAIVTADEGSSRELIEHERTGLLCAPGGAEGYADAVSRLVRDVPLQRRLGSAARRASEAYQWEHIFGSVIAAYREAVQRRTACVGTPQKIPDVSTLHRALG